MVKKKRNNSHFKKWERTNDKNNILNFSVMI